MQLAKEVGVTTYVLRLTNEEAKIVADCLDSDSSSYKIRTDNDWLYSLIAQLRDTA